MKKSIFTLLLIIVIITVLMFVESNKKTEVPGGPTEKTTINIGSLKGPTSIGMLKIMEDNKTGKASNTYNFTVTGTPDEITAKLVKGEIDIAAIPCNLASVLYKNTNGGVVVLSTNTLSVLNILEVGNEIKSIYDLKGKTIYTTGKGTVPEYTLMYLLEVAGIKDEVTVEFKSEPAEVATLLQQGTAKVAMLPQPYATTVLKQNTDVRIALDIGEEWNNLQEDNVEIITGVTVVRKEFLEDHKEAVIRFLEEYKTSTEYVNANIEKAATLSDEFDIIPLAVAKEAIPLCNITFAEGQTMKDMVSGYLQILFDKNPSSVGGTLPDENFYFKR